MRQASFHEGIMSEKRAELKTSRGTVFPIRSETEHYVLCAEPSESTDTLREALLDFEDLHKQGYRLCTVYGSPYAAVIFEKIRPL